jgi:outer membrane PBP1 activator LpoA protein
MIPYARSCATALTPRPPSTTNLRKANIALAKDDAQQAYDLFTHMSTDHLQLLLQAHRLDAHAMTRPASIIFSAGRQALIRAVLKTREQQRPDRDDRDDGLRFSATVRTPAEILHLEAANRLDLLAWLDVHADPEDVVTVTMEATGAAVPGTIAALRFGARRMR